MEGFYLLLGHLAGDYILQPDVLASNKANPSPGPYPKWDVDVDPQDRDAFRAAIEARNKAMTEWPEKNWKAIVGSLACAVHCTIYTACIWLASCWWMPWWGLVVCWLAHFALDRWRLARWLMDNVSGQKGFASVPGLAPWSVIVVDNTIHLLTLGAIAALCGRT